MIDHHRRILHTCGTDGIRPDAPSPAVLRDTAHHANDCMFGCVVVRLIFVCDDARNRRNEHDASPRVLSAHLLGCQLCTEEGSADIYVDCLCPLRFFDVQKVLTGPEDRSIAHQDV